MEASLEGGAGGGSQLLADVLSCLLPEIAYWELSPNFHFPFDPFRT